MQPEQRLHAGNNSKVSENFLTSYRNLSLPYKIQKQRERKERGRKGRKEGKKRKSDRKKEREFRLYPITQG